MLIIGKYLRYGKDMKEEKEVTYIEYSCNICNIPITESEYDKDKVCAWCYSEGSINV
jgi:hypothetical protein